MAAAMDVFLDNETQKKFLRVTTTQELEMDNTKLAKQLKDKDEECGHWYTEAHSLGRKNKALIAHLIVAEDEGDAMMKKITELHSENDRLQNMLCTCLRPRHKDINWVKDGFDGEQASRDCFLMDFENSCLEDFQKLHPGEETPTGPERHKHKEWAALIKQHVYPHHSDVDWSEYAVWVQQGGGDEWFTGDH